MDPEADPPQIQQCGNLAQAQSPANGRPRVANLLVSRSGLDPLESRVTSCRRTRSSVASKHCDATRRRLPASLTSDVSAFGRFGRRLAPKGWNHGYAQTLVALAQRALRETRPLGDAPARMRFRWHPGSNC